MDLDPNPSQATSESIASTLHGISRVVRICSQFSDAGMQPAPAQAARSSARKSIASCISTPEECLS